MNPFRSLFGITWRSILVAVGYFVGLVLAGMVSVLLGAQMPASAGSTQELKRHET